jgi:hypothetical protein
MKMLRADGVEERRAEQVTGGPRATVNCCCGRPETPTEADAAAIREAYETGGELAAAVELRRRFPGITDNATAREQARRIAAWTPLPYCPKPRRRIRKAPSE